MTQDMWRMLDINMGHGAHAGHAPDVVVVHATPGVSGYPSIQDCNGLPAKPPALDVMTNMPGLVLHVHLLSFCVFDLFHHPGVVNRIDNAKQGSS
jgi:hypothetical protein